MPFERAEFPFTAGLEEFIDKRQHTKLRKVNNLVWVKGRQLRCRRGSAALPNNGATPSAVTNLTSTGDGSDLIMLGDDTAYIYESTLTSFGRVGAVGALPAVAVTKTNTQIVQSAGDASDPNIGYLSGLYCLVANRIGSNQSTIVVEDATSGGILFHATTDVGFQPKIISLGTKFYIFGIDTNGAGAYQVNFMTVDISTSPPTASIVAAMGAPAAINTRTYDIAYSAASSKWALTFFSATQRTYVAMYTGAPFAAAADFNSKLWDGAAGTPYCSAVAFSAAGDTIYTAWGDAPNAGTTTDAWVWAVSTAALLPQRYAALKYLSLSNTANNGLISAQQIGIVETNAGTRECHVLLSGARLSTDGVVQLPGNATWSTRISGAGAIANWSFTGQMTLTSRPWAVSGKTYAIGASQANSTYFLADFTANSNPADGPITSALRNAIPLAMASTRSALSLNPNGISNVLRTPGSITSVVALTATKFVTLITQVQTNEVAPPLIYQRATFDIQAPQLAPAKGIDTWAVASGFVRRLSPRFVTEVCPLGVPWWLSAKANGAGNLTTGNYIYQACYALILDDGNIIRGPFSKPITLNVGGAAGDFELLYSDVVIGAFGNPDDINTSGKVILEIYRTQVNQSVLYRVATSGVGAPGGFAVIVDNVSDANLVKGVLAYWNGGGFANVNPGPSTITVRNADRIWLVAGEDQSTVYYSDPINTVTPPTFHDENTIYVGEGGPITGLAFLDDRLVIFKANDIFVVSGQPGNSAGFGGSLSNPQSVPAGGLGCISAKSPLVIPDGVMFQSTRGIELLDRSMQVTWLGASVADLVGAAGDLTGALLVPAQHQARFYFPIVTLVYDYIIHEWTSFDNGTTPTPALKGGRPVWQRSSLTAIAWEADGTPGTFSDDGVYITYGFATDWKKSALEGFQRVRKMTLLGEYASADGVQIQELTDYDESTVVATFSWSSAQIAALPNVATSKVVELECFLVQPKCEAMSFVYTSQPTDSIGNAGLYLNGIALEFRPKTRSHPRGSASRR